MGQLSDLKAISPLLDEDAVPLGAQVHDLGMLLVPLLLLDSQVTAVARYIYYQLQ